MRYADNKVKQRLYQQSRMCNSKINDLIWPVFELLQDSIHVHLSASFRKIWSKLNKSCWRKSQTKAFSAIKGTNSETNDPIRPVFQLVWDFIHVHLICKFQGTSNQNWRSYGDPKHFPIVSLWDLVVNIMVAPYLLCFKVRHISAST